MLLYHQQCNFIGVDMKTKAVAKSVVLGILVLVLSGCGTIGGAVSGAGQDLSKAGEWIRSR